MAGLTPVEADDAIALLLSLNRDDGVTLLLVEQNLRQSLAMSDFGYVLENGRIALEDTGAALLANEHTRKAYIGR
jgi:branched-chain amino acid transport system ATP-binding protein